MVFCGFCKHGDPTGLTDGVLRVFVIVAPVTKAADKKIHFHEIFLPIGTANLKYPSKIKVFQLRCVDKSRLSNLFSEIPFIWQLTVANGATEVIFFDNVYCIAIHTLPEFECGCKKRR